MPTLNPQQHEAVTSTAKTTLVLAGPGSGKTRVLTHRIGWLIQQGEDPGRILAVTFTNKAGDEMQERLAQLLSTRAAIAVTARTFHSWGARFLRREMPTLAPLLPDGLLPISGHNLMTRWGGNALRSNFSIYDDDDQERLLRDIVVKELSKRDKFVGPAQNFITRCKNHGVLPNDDRLADARKPADQDKQLTYINYVARLLSSNAVDFDDLLLYPYLLLTWDDPTLRKWQARYEHILVDEFQDTNAIQYNLLTLLSGGNATLTAVGDEDQSIYGWRYADYRHVQQLRQDDPRHNLVILNRNYRSGEGIVTAANELIACNEDRIGKTLVAANGGGRIEVVRVADETDEAETIASMVEDTLAQGVSPDEIAVIYRMHALSREIETAFVRASLPYQLAQGASFYERREIRDVMAYLRFLHNSDALSFSRILNRPKRGIGAKTEQTLMDAIGTENALDWLSGLYQAGQLLAATEAPARKWKPLAKQFGLDMGGARAQRIWRLAELVVDLQRGLQEKSLSNVIRRLINLLKRSWEKLDRLEERVENAEELLTVAAKVEAMDDVDDTLEVFLDQVALVTQGDNVDDNLEAVTLATLHAAKGREWDMVFIAGAEDDICPHRRSVEETGDCEEERRLFYVGVTRARETVVISHAARRMLFGEIEYNVRSPFVREMGY